MSTNPYEAPQVGVDTGSLQHEEASTDLKSVLFSFQGRIPRRIFWGYLLATTFLFYAIIFSLALVTGDQPSIAAIVTLVLYVPVIWISLALQVKRWHDRDKSGWWVCIGFIPVIGPLWTLIEAGCLRGTDGPNRFGNDPT